MYRLASVMITAIVLASLGCGGGSSPNVIQGAWNASLTNPDGTTAFTFTATLTQSGKVIDVTDFVLGKPSQCFGKQTSESGFFMNPTHHSRRHQWHVWNVSPVGSGRPGHPEHPRAFWRISEKHHLGDLETDPAGRAL